MEKSPQLFDVCVVCALLEEARALLEVLQQQGEGAIEEGISPRYHYSYRFATLKNDKDELPAACRHHDRYLCWRSPPRATGRLGGGRAYLHL